MEKLIGEYELELCEVECIPGAPFYSAKAHIPGDVSQVMPYLNGVLDRAFYSGDNEYIIWKDDERKYVLRPHELAASLIFDRPQARQVISKAVAWINDVWDRRESIVPDHRKRSSPQPLEVLRLLPGTNCSACGLPTCMAFAFELIEGNVRIDDCPEMLLEENAGSLEQLKELGL